MQKGGSRDDSRFRCSLCLLLRGSFPQDVFPLKMWKVLIPRYTYYNAATESYRCIHLNVLHSTYLLRNFVLLINFLCYLIPSVNLRLTNVVTSAWKNSVLCCDCWVFLFYYFDKTKLWRNVGEAYYIMCKHLCLRITKKTSHHFVYRKA